MSIRTGSESQGSGLAPECAAHAALLPLYALGELEPGEAARLRAHEAGCAWCQARLAEYDALRQGIAQAHSDEYGGGQLAPFSPFSLSEIMLAEHLSEEDQSGSNTAFTETLSSAPAAGHRPAPRVTAGRRRQAASRELPAIAAALLLTLAAALTFSSLRGSATLPAGPRISEYPANRGSESLAEIAAGPDGALWFTDVAASQITRMTPGGALTTFNLPTRNAQPLGIAAGPDGALWFTESALGRIGRITQSGAITEYPLPSAGGWPVDIALGPDGALWFTERNAGRIGRVTSDGVITEYALPHAGSLPTTIALGPDDALWFTEPGSGQIARMTTTGAVTEFPAPGAGRLGGLTAGPDGNLWFTETGAIARLTRQGVITRFPLSSASILPGGITAGPDGALWFTEYSETNPITCDGSHVGRITTAGHISEYALPTPHSCASAITASSTTLWFIEAGQNAIGEIRPAD